MKADLKKRLNALWPILGEMQAEVAAITEAHTSYMEERSERWHESEAGTRAEMDSGELDEMDSGLEEVVAALDRIIHA